MSQHVLERLLRVVASLVVAGSATWACTRPTTESISDQRSLPAAIGTGGIAVGEPIVGRSRVGGQVMLLTAGKRVFVVDPEHGVFRQMSLSGLRADDEPWGLAGLADGTLWTLVNRDTLGELAPTGALRRRIALDAPCFNLFGVGVQLLLQPAAVDPPAPALVAFVPDRPSRETWGPLRTRPFPRARGEVMVLNLLDCGFGETDTTPCWFLSAGAIAVVRPDGAGQVVTLQGVRIPSADDLLARGRAVRAIRDAFSTTDGGVWVLGADLLKPQTGETQEWTLVKFSAAGAVQRTVALDEPARYILAVGAGRARLLTIAGRMKDVPL